MAFRIPTVAELHAFALAVGRAVLPEIDWSRRKTGWKWFGVVTQAVSSLHAHIVTATRDLMPDTARGTMQTRWAALKGLAAKPATQARGSGVLRVFGTAASTVAIGDLLVHEASGLSFQVNSNGTITVDYVDVDVLAIAAGSAGKLSTDEVLTFSSPPAGISEQAILVGDIDTDGADQESESALADRIFARFATPPVGGGVPDYEQWATAITGIASAYVYPNRVGLGSVDLAALHTGRGAARLLTGGEIADVQATVEEQIPVGVEFRVLEVEAVDVDVEITVEPVPLAAYQFDWDDTTPLVVATWTAATRTLEFTTDRPASMGAGDRITIKPAGGSGTGEQFVIEALAVAADSIVLSTTPDLAPVATDTVYSGGPLVDAVRDAVLEHFDGLGPTNPDLSPYGVWEGNVRPENLYAIAQTTTGVRTSTVIAPAAVVEMDDNPYPDDGIVFLAAPRRVLVRKA